MARLSDLMAQGAIYTPNASQKPPKIEVGSHEHKENSSFLHHWAEQMREVLWRKQDCLGGDEYEQRLLRHGLWSCFVQRDDATGLILSVVVAHTPPGKAPVTWCLGGDKPYQELVKESGMVLRQMADYNRAKAVQDAQKRPENRRSREDWYDHTV